MYVAIGDFEHLQRLERLFLFGPRLERPTDAQKHGAPVRRRLSGSSAAGSADAGSTDASVGLEAWPAEAGMCPSCMPRLVVALTAAGSLVGVCAVEVHT